MFFFLIPEFQDTEERYEWLMAHLTAENISALRRKALQMMRKWHDAEEVLDDAMVAGVKYCHQIKDETKVFPWMVTILRRKATRRLIKKPLRTLYNDADIRQILFPGYQENIETHVENKYAAKYALQLMEGLKSPVKEIVMMRALEGMDYHDIADHLHINYHTVRSTHNRAVTQMRREMEKMNHE